MFRNPSVLVFVDPLQVCAVVEFVNAVNADMHRLSSIGPRLHPQMQA